MADTMCVVPWSSLVIQPDGCASFCCDAPDLLEVDGRLGNVGRDSLDDLWNSEGLVQTRAAMARGERPVACRACWQREERGVTSRRHFANDLYRRGGGELDISSLAQAGAASGYRLDRAPDWFIVELGNVCNLRCRSCNPLSSSRIAADPLHVSWSEGFSSTDGDTGFEPRRAPSGAAESTWFRDTGSLADMIASGAQGTAMLSLIGGEPFMIKQTWQLLEALVERGVSQNIYAGLLTNGQHRSRRVEELAPAFRGFNVSISIDGYGPLYEYLRSGGSWSRLVENLDWLQAIPGISVAITPTLQNANALDMVTLLSFLEDRELTVIYNAVDHPGRLRPDNLPAPIRLVAAARLREYLGTECLARNAGVVRAYCERLEAPEAEFDTVLFDEFLRFTREMDASRGESLAKAAPELVALLEAEGVLTPAAAA